MNKTTNLRKLIVSCDGDEPRIESLLEHDEIKLVGDEISLALENPKVTLELLQLLAKHGLKVFADDVRKHLSWIDDWSMIVEKEDTSVEQQSDEQDDTTGIDGNDETTVQQEVIDGNKLTGDESSSQARKHEKKPFIPKFIDLLNFQAFKSELELVTFLFENMDQSEKVKLVHECLHLLIAVLVRYQVADNTEVDRSLQPLRLYGTDSNLQLLKTIAQIDGIDVNYSPKSSDEKPLLRTLLQEAISDDGEFEFEFEFEEYLLDNFPNLIVNQVSEKDSRPPFLMALGSGKYDLAHRMMSEFCGQIHGVTAEQMLMTVREMCFKTNEGFGDTFRLMYALGYKFDFPQMLDIWIDTPALDEDGNSVCGCCMNSTTVLREAYQFRRYLKKLESETMKQVSSLKQQSALAVRKSLNTKIELDQVLAAVEWTDEIKAFLKLDHLPPFYPDDYDSGSDWDE